jgi:hypothetical protein
MTNLTDLLPAGAGGKQVSFTASGTISSGQTVALQTDGTVSAVASTGGDPSTGTAVVFEAGALPTSNETGIAFDSSNNKVVISYVDTQNAFYGTAVVGTVSGTSISFGTPVVFESSSTGSTSATFDSSNNKVVIAYNAGGSDYGTAIVGTVSGTSISFGSSNVFEAATTYNISTVFDSNSNRVVITYRDNGNSDYGTSIVGSVSGTAINFSGSPVTFNTAGTYSPTSVFDSSNNKVVVVYKDANSSFYGTAKVGTVSGSSISFGSATVFESANSEPYIAFDTTENKVVIIYEVPSPTTFKGIVGTVSGTSISFGSATSIGIIDSSTGSVTYDSSLNKIVAFYNADGDSYAGSFVVGTVSGTSISFGTPVSFTGAQTYNYASTFDSNANKVVVAYTDTGNSSYGTAAVVSTSTSTNTDFVGIADAAISDTASGNITIKGGIASSGLSGLTPNATYYVQDDGILAASGSIPYAIANASYDNISFSVNSQVSNPFDIAFNNDGSKMYVVNPADLGVYEYELSSNFDVSTAVYQRNKSFAADASNLYAMTWNSDGTKLYLLFFDSTYTVESYSLSTAFLITSATSDSVSLTVSQDTSPQNITFNDDGTKLFMVGIGSDKVYQYSLTSGFDLSTGSYDSVDFSVASQETSPKAVEFNDDGTQMFVVGPNADTIYEYGLTSGFDLSTASYSSISYNVNPEEADPRGLAFNSDGTKFYIIGGVFPRGVYQYSTTAASTTVVAGKALSATSINLDYSS